MEISLLPKLKPTASFEDYNEWLNEFSAFTDIVLKEEEINEKGVKFIKYAISGSKLAVTFDETTTFKSGPEKIKNKFSMQSKSPTPLKDFYQCQWINTDLNFGQYMIKLKPMVQFITHSAAKEQLIVQHCLEQFRSEFRIILKEKKLSELVDTISELQKSEICINSENLSCISSAKTTEERRKITCYNCLKSGHVAPDCRQRKKMH